MSGKGLNLFDECATRCVCSRPLLPDGAVKCTHLAI